MDRFLAWVDRRNFISIRAATLGVTVWMTWRVTVWAFSITQLWILSDKSGIETAAVVAAVTAPFAALQAFAFKWYLGAK
jgi:hypothetical protein